jgi:hypothetical protein
LIRLTIDDLPIVNVLGPAIVNRQSSIVNVLVSPIVPSGRSVFAIIAGYLVFALSAVILFQVAGVNPHAEAALGFKAFSTMWGVLFALGAGFLAAKLAPRRPLAHAIVVAALVGIGATASLFSVSGAKWSQLSALLLMTPAVVLGGVMGSSR